MSQMLKIPSINTWGCVVPQLVNQANDLANASHDEVYHDFSYNFEMNANGSVNIFGYKDDLSLTDFSASQLCGKIGMPIQYFRKLAVGSPSFRELAQTNINTLLHAYRGSMMVRTTDDSIRGILSDKYVPFDTHEILDTFTEVFDSAAVGLIPQIVRFRGIYMSPDRFHMRFTSSTPLPNLPDRDLYAGLQIDSSDVGKARLSVRFFLFKQICTNGMCISLYNHNFFTQRHIGVQKDDFAEGLRRSLIAFPLVAEQATDIIRQTGAVSLAGSPIFKLENNDAVIKAMQTYFRLSEEEVRDVVDIARVFYPKTVWGFANAVTQKAREFGFERRNVVETLAGNFLTDYRRLGVA